MSLGSAYGIGRRRDVLDVETLLDEGRAVVRVGGDLDVYTCGLLRTALGEILDQAPRPLLAFELSELAFCDSSGLGVLIGAYKRVQADRGATAVASIVDPLAMTLRITGLVKVLHVEPTLESALCWLDAQYAPHAQPRSGGYTP